MTKADLKLYRKFANYVAVVSYQFIAKNSLWKCGAPCSNSNTVLRSDDALGRAQKSPLYPLCT